MKIKIAVILYLFLLFFPISLLGNTNDQCGELIDSAKKEQVKKNYLAALELYSHARILAENSGDKEQLFHIYRNMGVNYSYMSDYGESLSAFIDAYKVALEMENNQHIALALGNISILYMREKNYPAALEYQQRAYDIAIEGNDELMIGRFAQNIASIANEAGELDLAEQYIAIATQPQYLENDPEGRYYVKLTEIEIMIAKRQFKQAEQLTFKILPELINSEYKIFLPHSYFLLSEIYFGLEDFHQCIEYANKALASGINLEEKVRLYERISETYFRQKSYDKARIYNDSVKQTINALHNLNVGNIFELNNLKANLYNQQKELATNKAKHKTERYILALTVVLLLIFIWALYISLRQHRQKTLLAERNRKIAELELRERETLAQLEKETLNNEIERKNRKLTTNTLLNSTKNRMLKELIDNLLKDIDSPDTPQNIKKKLNYLNNQLSKDKKEDDSFLRHFEEINTGFTKSLKAKHPNLSSYDMKFLSFIYMNLSNKEIASLLNIAPESCKRKKTRLHHKMEIEEGMTIYDYLISILM